MANSLTTEQKQGILSDLKAGMSPVDVATKYKVAPSAVYYTRSYAAIKSGKTMGKKHKGLDQQAIIALCEDIRSGMGRTDVMKKHGVGGTAYNRWRQRLEKGMVDVPKPEANGHANPMEAIVIELVRNRLRTDAAFAGRLALCLSSTG